MRNDLNQVPTPKPPVPDIIAFSSAVDMSHRQMNGSRDTPLDHCEPHVIGCVVVLSYFTGQGRDARVHESWDFPETYVCQVLP